MQLGTHAVSMIAEQQFGDMVCWNPPVVSSVPISDAIHINRVTRDSSIVQCARALGISFGDAPENAAEQETEDIAEERLEV